jgi:hypothetical protein
MSERKMLAVMQICSIADKLAADTKAAAESEKAKKYEMCLRLAAGGPWRRSNRRVTSRTQAGKARAKSLEGPDASCSPSGHSNSDPDSASEGHGNAIGIQDEEYDPLDDLSEHEDDDADDEDHDSLIDSDLELEQDSKRCRKRSSRTDSSAGRRRGKRAEAHAVEGSDAQEDESFVDSFDNELQMALAMSLMDSQTHPGSSHEVKLNSAQAGSADNALPPKENCPAPPFAGRMAPMRTGLCSEGAAEKWKRSTRSKTGKRMQAVSREVSRQDITKAFAMLAPRGKNISAQGLAEVLISDSCHACMHACMLMSIEGDG